MDFDSISVLFQSRPSSISDLLKITPKLSFSQSKITIIIGKSLITENSLSKIKQYLEFLDIIDLVQIKGLPQDLSLKYLQEFIENYFSTLAQLVEKVENRKFNEIVAKKIEDHLIQNAEKYINEFIKAYKSIDNCKSLLILTGWSHLAFTSKVSKFLFKKCCSAYLKDFKISLKYEKTHIVTLNLLLNLLKSNSKIFKKEHELVSMLFKKNQQICRKYIEHKTSKEQIFLLSCEIIIFTVTNPFIIEFGLKNISFPPIFSKTCYSESYLSYFFNQTYLILKRPGIATRLLLCTKDYLLEFLKEHLEFVPPCLNSFHLHLKSVQEPELIATIVRIIRDLFEITEEQTKIDVFLPYLLKCFHDLPTKISSDLINSCISLVPQGFFNVIDPLFRILNTNSDENSINWIKKVSKGVKNIEKISEILDILLNLYKTSNNIDKVSIEILKTLASISENFPKIVLEKIINTAIDMLIHHEKQLWINKKSSNLSGLISKSFSLITLLKSCASKVENFSNLCRISEFWCMVSHFCIQYPLKDLISIMDLNETLSALAKITPALIDENQKDMPAYFLHLFQAPDYSKSLLQKLKSHLQPICSKKKIEGHDYSFLLTAATIHKILSITPSESLLSVSFSYLSIDFQSFQAFCSEFITDIVLGYWKEKVRKNECPVNDIVILLKNCLSVHKQVRNLAMKLLNNSSTSVSVIFFSVFYSKKGLSAILDILGALHYEVNNEYSSTSSLINLPHEGLSILLPSSRVIISEIYTFISNFVNEALLKALCQSPQRVLSPFSHYVFSSNKLIKNSVSPKTHAITNFGISIVHHHYYSSRILLFSDFSLLESYLNPEKFHNWFKSQKKNQNFYIKDENTLQLQGTYLSMADNLIENGEGLYKLISKLKKYQREDPEIEAYNSEIFDLLGKIVGMMVIQEEKYFYCEVIRVPLSNPSIVSITAAIFCWEWVCSSLPSIRPLLFFELSVSLIEFFQESSFFLQKSPFSRPLVLIHYNSFTNPDLSKQLENALLIISFIQTQTYSSGDDPLALKQLLKLLFLILSNKMNPEVLNYESGVEGFLRLLELVLDILYFFNEEIIGRIKETFFDFFLSAYLVMHKWIKCSSIVKFGNIKQIYEKCLNKLENFKSNEEFSVQQKHSHAEEPNTWDLRLKELIFINKISENCQSEVKNSYKKDIFVIFLHHEYQRFVAWNSGSGQMMSSSKTQKSARLLKAAWKISDFLGENLSKILKSDKKYPKNLGENEEERLFLFSKAIDLPLVLNFLDCENVSERSFHLKLLLRSPERCNLYFMQQVLQCGSPTNAYQNYSRVMNTEDVWTYLSISAMKSSVFLNQLIWMLEVSMFNVDSDISHSLGHCFYKSILGIIEKNPEEWEKFNTEQSYFEKFALISAGLTPKDPENFNKINENLEKLSKNIPNGVYIPTNPNCTVVGLRSDNGRPLQSAKRTPILVTFQTKTNHSSKIKSTQCIFKVNDDVRNDQLCLQVIELMKEILVGTGIKIYLRPYKVISNITHTPQGDQLSGIIECIPNCKSRDEIGKEGTESLYTYFLEKFGPENSEAYLAAKKNFISSLAGYAVASYVLQIKDRHNGNILIDDLGHILHIDFGFILSISPGGNMRFERPGFKLTQEMIDVMGKNDKESFEFFKGLVVKGYLAVREHAHSFISLVKRMEFSGLTCFRKGAVKDFIKRFYLNYNIPEAIKKVNEKISRANNSFFTLWYDRIQLMQQQIEY